MATSIKELLVKLKISRDEWDKMVADIAKQQTAMNAGAARAHAVKVAQLQLEQKLQTQIQSDSIKNQLQQTQLIQQQTKLKKDQLKAMQDEVSQAKASLNVKQAELKAMAAMNTYSKEAIGVVQQELSQQRALLAVREAQVRQAALLSKSSGGGVMSAILGAVVGGQGLQGAGSAVGGMIGGGVGGALGATVGGLIGGALVGALTSYIEKLKDAVMSSGEFAEKLTIMATRAGVTVTEMSTLAAVGRQVGISGEEMSSMMMRWEQQFGRLQNGISNSERVLNAFGVAVRKTDGTLRDPYNVLLDLADVFSKMPDGIAKNELAFQVLGRRAVELLPVLNKGRAEFEKWAKLTGQYGPAAEDIQKAAEAHRAMAAQLEIMNQRWDKLANTLGQTVLPLVTTFLENANKALDIWSHIIDKIGSAAKATISAIPSLELGTEMPTEGTPASKDADAEKNKREQARKDAQDKETQKRLEAALDAQKVAQIRMQTDLELTDAELSNIKTRIAAQKEEVETRYKLGLTAESDYIQKLKDLNDAEFKAELDAIKKRTQLRKQEVAQKFTTSTKDEKTGQVTTTTNLGSEGSAEMAREDALAKKDIEAATLQHQQRLKAINLQGVQDILAVQRTYNAELRKLADERYQEAVKKTQDEFQDGKLSAEQYMQERRTQIQELYTLSVAAAKQQYDESEKNGEALARLNVALIEAEVKRQKELTALYRAESDIRIKVIENQYKAQLDLLQAQGEFAKPGVAAAVGMPQASLTANLRQQYDLTEQYLQRLLNEQHRLEMAGDMYSKAWVEVTKQIAAAGNEIVRLNTELAKSKDWATPLASIFGDLGKALSGRLGAGGKASFANIEQSLKDLSKYMTGYGAQHSGNALIDAFAGVRGLFGGSLLNEKQGQRAGRRLFGGQQQPTDPVKAAAQQAAQKLNEFDEKLKGTADTVQQKFDDSLTKFGSNVDTNVGQLQNLAQAAQQAAQKLLTIGQPGRAAQPGAPGIGGESNTAPQDVGGGGGGDSVTGSPIVGGIPGLGGDSNIDGIIGSIGNSLNNFDQYVQKSNAGLTPFAEKLGNAEQAISGLVSGIGNFIQGTFGAKSTGGGILSGGLSGMSLGMEVGGPIGAAVGGVAGAVMGGIFGSKRAEADKLVNRYKEIMKQTVDSLNNGTIQLGTAIQQLQQERQDAINALSGSKKGRQQLPSLLSAFDQEISQLQQQAAKLLQQLRESVSILRAPAGEDQVIQSIQTIMDKYNQFASAAAGNAAAMAMANNFLILSLKKYETTLGDDIRKAQETAIDDALHYMDLVDQQNQLLQDRNNIIQQANQQIQDILSQGNVVRSRAVWAQKGQQIYDIQTKEQQDLTNIDKQIAANQEEMKLTQYKLSVENKIFNLATTRIGLEQQLLAAQQQDAQEQLAIVQGQIAAYAKIAQYLANPAYPLGLNANAGNPLLNVLYMLGLSPRKSDYYYPGEWPGTGGGTGGGVGSGRGGSGRGGRGGGGGMREYQGGGPVSQTGPALVHKGEFVVPPVDSPALGQLITSVISAVTTAGTPAAAGVSSHQQMLDMAASRANLEFAILAAHREQAQLDVARVQTMTTLLDKIIAFNSTGGAVVSLEGAFSKIYELRGRYAAGGFTREHL